MLERISLCYSIFCSTCLLANRSFWVLAEQSWTCVIKNDEVFCNKVLPNFYKPSLIACRFNKMNIWLKTITTPPQFEPWHDFTFSFHMSPINPKSDEIMIKTKGVPISVYFRHSEYQLCHLNKVAKRTETINIANHSQLSHMYFRFFDLNVAYHSSR